MARIPEFGSSGGGGAPIPGTAGAGLGVYNTGYLNQQAQRLAPAPDIPMVWLGERETDRPVPPTRGQGALFRTAPRQVETKTANVNALMLKFESMSVEKKRDLARKLAMAGFLTAYKDEPLGDLVKRTTLAELADAYGALLQDAAGRYASGQTMNPNQILDMHIRYNMAMGGIAGAEDASLDKLWDSVKDGNVAVPEEPFTGTKKFTSTNIVRDIYSPQEARSLAEAMLSQELGRDPTQAEFEDWVGSLQAAMRKHPTKSKTTTTSVFDEGELVDQTSNTVNTGGLDVAGWAEDKAEANPNWAEWQAVGTYFPALMNMLGSAVPGT